MKKIFAIIKPVIRGAVKGVFPGAGAVIEAVKKGVNKESPHNWGSIIMQIIGAAFLWWAVATGKIDISKVLEYFGL